LQKITAFTDPMRGLHHVSAEGAIRMNSKSRLVFGLAALCAVLALSAARAADVKPTDEGSAEEFKGKKYDVEEKGKTAVTLAFPAG
jgi:hypothetical protein